MRNSFAIAAVLAFVASGASRKPESAGQGRPQNSAINSSKFFEPTVTAPVSAATASRKGKPSPASKRWASLTSPT